LELGVGMERGLLEGAFGAGDALDAWVALGGKLEGFGEGFEDGFEEVVWVGALDDVDVEGEAGVLGEGAEEFNDELCGEGAGVEVGEGEFFGGAEDEEGAAADVEGEVDEGFVHGEVAEAVAVDAGVIAEGLVDGHAEDDADVFDGVVVVDVEIAVGVEVDVEEGVFGEESEHVVEKGDAGVDAAAAVAVEVEAEADAGFGGGAVDGGGAWG
jgi:hypothetical protein